MFIYFPLSPNHLLVTLVGNPTGQVLSPSDMEEILKYAAEENLVVFADEVYQENIWRKDRPFHSFKKVFIYYFVFEIFNFGLKFLSQWLLCLNDDIYIYITTSTLTVAWV